MLPTDEQFGVRLAAILPSAVSLLTETAPATTSPRCIIVMVVDGLGWHNLQARRGHARQMCQYDATAITTVLPTTTGAALSTLTTGKLPGTHGLVGYRIRHPKFGLRTTLSEWDGIDPVRSWQSQPTVFEQAQASGVSSHVIGRAAHRTGGLTEAILTGAAYHSGDTIESRCERALHLARTAREPSLVYVYVDELDRAGHRYGWESARWIERLEQLDVAAGSLVSGLPADVGFILTADHGMVDIPTEHHVHLDEVNGLMDGVQSVGGEPRLRYLYLQDAAQAPQVAARIQTLLGERALVFTRETLVREGVYGTVADDVMNRIGDVIVCANESYAFFVAQESPVSQSMIGHHGSISATERHVPLITAGNIFHEDFTKLLGDYAAAPRRRKPRR